MRLKAKNRTFTVYQTLGSYQDVYVYLAREGADQENRYLVNEIQSPQMIRTYLDELLSLQKDDNFSEFVDLFTLNSKLYLVFKYAKPFLFMDFLNKYTLSFPEKVTLMNNYLFQLSSYTRFSPIILQALTDPENINVSPDGTAYFNFSLKPQHFADPADKSAPFQGIAALLKTLFAKELASRKKKQLLFIIEKCEKGLYKSIPELKKDVQEIDTFSTWDKIKEYFQARKSVLKIIKNVGLAALIVVFLVIIYTRFIAPGPAQRADAPLPVEQIGEVTVQEEEETDENDEAESPDPEQPRRIRIDTD